MDFVNGCPKEPAQGLQAARARGRIGGRPKALSTAQKVKMARELYANKNNKIADICKSLHISRATLYRYVKA
jgi:DNA invertase Pin-like site-specific DNA recombinase